MARLLVGIVVAGVLLLVAVRLVWGSPAQTERPVLPTPTNTPRTPGELGERTPLPQEADGCAVRLDGSVERTGTWKKLGCRELYVEIERSVPRVGQPIWLCWYGDDACRQWGNQCPA